MTATNNLHLQFQNKDGPEEIVRLLVDGALAPATGSGDSCLFAADTLARIVDPKAYVMGMCRQKWGANARVISMYLCNAELTNIMHLLLAES